MGRVPTVESKEKVSSVKWNQLVADYLSQTDTGTQAIGGIVYIGRRASDPDTAGWGEAQKGYLWFNLTEGKYKYWNGAAIVAFPSAGGAGAPVDASYVTINAEAGLEGEIQHANIVDEAQKHTPKIHTHDEADITDLDHDALKIKGVTVDDSGIGADKYLKYDGANVAYGSLPAGSTYKLAPSYTIYKVGATYYAMDEDGDTSINGNNAATVVNAALAALTGGRTWKETVLLKGNITADDKIEVPSYTRLKIEGYLKYANNGNLSAEEGFITNDDIAGGNSHIELCGGGEVDGNGSNNLSVRYDTIRFDNVTDFEIYNLRVGGGMRPTATTGAGACVAVADCERGEIYTIKGYMYSTVTSPQGTYDFIKVWSGCKQIHIHDNIMDGYNGRWRPNSIQIVDGTDILCTNNSLSPASGDAAGFKVHGGHRVHIIGNHVYGKVGVESNDRVLAGVDIINDGDNVVIKNNSFYFCRYGVRHSDAQAEHLVIRDNDIMLADVEFACAVNLTDTNHAVIANNDVSVLGNVNASKGIWIHSGCTNTLIKDNTFTVDIDTIVDNDAGTETKEVDSETLSYP